MTRAGEADVRRRAALGLGGNVGDVAAAMARALRALDGRGDCSVVSVSSLYRTPPWGKTDQAWFANACAIVVTELEPEGLLDACLEVERQLERDRERAERWGPRTIDIDVLTFDDRAIDVRSDDGGRLIIPHPRMSERGFVLLPLAEIAPDLVVRGRSVAEWARLADAAGIEKTGDGDWWRRS